MSSSVLSILNLDSNAGLFLNIVDVCLVTMVTQGLDTNRPVSHVCVQEDPTTQHSTPTAVTLTPD